MAAPPASLRVGSLERPASPTVSGPSPPSRRPATRFEETISLLERAGVRQMAAEFMAMSSEAHLSNGTIELATGARESAAHHLNAALATLQAIGAEFEIAHLSEDRDAAGTHLTQAVAFFSAARSSNYLSRAAALATRIGVDLPGVAGSS